MNDVTEKLLRTDNHACESGYKWWLDNNKPSDARLVIKKLMSEDHFDWSNWLIVRLMTHDQKIKYAIYAAEQVIDIYEKKYPDDDRPRKAIDAAKKYLKVKSIKNKNAAAAAAYAAYDAAYAAYAAAAYADAADTAYAAADAAYAAYADAADAAYADAADAAYAAADAAADAADAAAAAYADAADAAYAAADAAAYADADASKKLQTKIIKYGMKLLAVKN